jgi:glycosyltransferase involved in cell wall biosynthesis
MPEGMTIEVRAALPPYRQAPDSLNPIPRVSVVVPTLNEAANLPHVFAELPHGLHEVIVVDGFSKDDTIEVAKQLRPDVKIVLQERRGKGNALACGFAAATGDIIVMLDADGSADPAEIPAFVDALLAGADFAKGSRYLQGGGSTDLTGLRSAGNKALSATVNLFFGTRYSDLCYGYNAFWSHCLPAMSVDCDGFEVETLINIRIARAGLKVAEVPSFERDRIHGESNLNTFRDGTRVLRTILRERLSRRPAQSVESFEPASATA